MEQQAELMPCPFCGGEAELTNLAHDEIQRLTEALKAISGYTLEAHGSNFGTAFMDLQRIARDALPQHV